MTPGIGGAARTIRPLVAGNWKMNGVAARLAEAQAVRDALIQSAAGADVMICPPATLLAQMASDRERFEGSARRPGLPRRGERRLHRRCLRRDAGRRRGDGGHRRPLGAARGARRARPHRARQGGGGAPRRPHRHRLRRRDGGRAQRRADRDGGSPAARSLAARCRDGRQHRRRLRAGVGDRHRPHADQARMWRACTRRSARR